MSAGEPTLEMNPLQRHGALPPSASGTWQVATSIHRACDAFQTHSAAVYRIRIEASHHESLIVRRMSLGQKRTLMGTENTAIIEREMLHLVRHAAGRQQWWRRRPHISMATDS